MNTRDLSIVLTKLWQLTEMALFYGLNRHRFGRLQFRSVIQKPQIIEGYRYISVMRGVRIRRGASLFALKIDHHDPDLRIGTGCSIGYNNHIAAVRNVCLGEYVLTANNVYISDNLHGYEDITLPVMHQPVKFKGVSSIGNGSWIGENACIIGAKLGKHCIVGANSVVNQDVPDYCVVVGAPARIIRRFDTDTGRWVKFNEK